ncbi:MAG TPA: class I SAM-dependent methyltransferase [Candidatus Limnocylindrales bacterium]
MTLRGAWEGEARNWIAWARKPGHDSYWRFHRDAFLESLPEPPRGVLDGGCGEGRLPRDLQARGYDVVGLDGSPTLIAAASEADPSGTYVLGDLAALPFADASFELVTAFMSLQDVDDPDAALREIQRVLVPGGRIRSAIVHPMNSAGGFEAAPDAVAAPDEFATRNARADDAPFVIRESYFEERLYVDQVERDGLPMTFASLHRPLERIIRGFLDAGLRIDHFAEIPDVSSLPGSRWRRIPLFLHLGAEKPVRR